MDLFKKRKQTRTVDTGNAEVKVPMDGAEPDSYSLYQARVCLRVQVNLLRAVSAIKKR